MAFMSIGGILKSIKSQGQILWKLSMVRALSLPTESAVSSPAFLRLAACAEASADVVWPCLASYLADPDLAFLTWLPGLTSDLPRHYGFVWWLQTCWPTLVTITRPALRASLGCRETAWLLGEDAAQPAWLSPLAPGSLSLAEQPALTTPWHTS